MKKHPSAERHRRRASAIDAVPGRSPHSRDLAARVRIRLGPGLMFAWRGAAQAQATMASHAYDSVQIGTETCFHSV